MDRKVSLLASLPSRQTFSGFSSTYANNGNERYFLFQERLRLDDFKLNDRHAHKQRQIMSKLLRQEQDLVSHGLVPRPSPKSKQTKWGRSKDRLSLAVEVEIPPKKKSATAKLNKFLLSRNKSKPDQSYILHLIKLAIRDMNQSRACKLVHSLKSESLTKKCVSLANLVFLMAINANMDNLVILLMEKNFPKSLNDPIFVPPHNSLTSSSSTSSKSFYKSVHSHSKKSSYPSYFLVAVSLGNENIIKYMIKKGCNLNTTWFGLTPLHLACSLNRRGNAHIVKLLLENGADPSIILLTQQYFTLIKLKSIHYLENKMTSIMNSGNFASSSSLSPLSSLLSRDLPLKKNKMNSAAESFSQLMEASKTNGSPTFTARWLKKKRPSRVKIKSDIEVPFSIYPLEFAAATQNLEAVSNILRRLEGNMIDIVSKCYFSLLVQQDVDISIRLIKAGAPLYALTKCGSSPLHLAARMGNVELIAVYLSFNFNIDLLDLEFWTPLHEAAYFGHHEAVKYFIGQGASVLLKNCLGDTPVQVALKSGFASEEIIEYFEKSNHLDLDSFQEVNMNVEQLIAEIGDNRLCDSGIKRRRSRFFKFRSSSNKPSRFTVEKYTSSPPNGTTPYFGHSLTIGDLSSVNNSFYPPDKISRSLTTSPPLLSSQQSTTSNLSQTPPLPSYTSSFSSLFPFKSRTRTVSAGTPTSSPASLFSAASKPINVPTSLIEGKVNASTFPPSLSNISFGQKKEERKSTSTLDLRRSFDDDNTFTLSSLSNSDSSFPENTRSFTPNSIEALYVGNKDKDHSSSTAPTTNTRSFSLGSMTSFAKFWSGKSKNNFPTKS